MTTATASPETATPPDLLAGEVAIVLPPGVTLEDLGSPPGPPAPEVLAEPAAPAAAPAAPAAPRKGSPATAFRVLRTENRDLKREVERLKTAPVLPALTNEDWKEIHDKVEDAGSIAAGVRIALEHVSSKATTVRQGESQRTRQAEQQRQMLERVQRSQEAFKQAHTDYDRRLIDSGVFEDFQAGGDIAHSILQAEDPAAYAYHLATDRLRDLGLLDEYEAPADPPPPTPTPPTPAARPARAAAPAPAPAPAAPAADPVAAARVVQEFVTNPTPVRGVRSLPSAGGQARAAMSEAELNRLRDTDPNRWYALVKGTPELERKLLGG